MHTAGFYVPRKRWLAYLGFALLLHMGFLFIVKPGSYTVPLQPSVKLKLITQAPTKPVVESLPTTPTRSSTKTVAPATSAVTTPNQLTQTRTYEKLLPAYGAQMFTGQSDSQTPSATSLGEQLKPHEQMNGDVVASKLSIPLKWRKTHDAAKATAVLAVGREQEIILRSLFGEPVLRAVVYEWLRKPETVAYFKRFLNVNNRSDYRIVLLYRNQVGAARTLNAADHVTVFEDGIEIIKTMPMAMRDFGGTSVSDGDFKKGERRDAQELAKLMESPAFAAALTERRL